MIRSFFLKTRFMVIAAALMIIAGYGIPWSVSAQELGDCIRAEVPMQMVMPDGSVHEAGTLRLCMSRNYSPVSALHRTSVDGRVIGMYMSRKGTSEGETETPNSHYMLFRREGVDRLVLIGFGWPDGDRANTYRLREMKRRSTAEIARDDSHHADDTVLLYALRN